MIWRILSLDVVLGALASGGMVVGILGGEMPWAWWVVLPLSVWVMYTADHLLDAYRLKEAAHTPRHLFHYYHMYKIGAACLVVAIVCGCVLPWWLPREIIWFGVGMGLLVLLHLGLVRLIGERISWFFHKELGVGAIYAAGIWGGPAAMQIASVMPVHVLLFVQFFLLAMMNLLLFSMYESDTDELDGHTSFARAIGKRNVHRFIVGFACLIGLLGVIALCLSTSMPIIRTQVIFMLMGGILLLILYYPVFFQVNERYRSWGDGVFLLPFLGWIG